MSAPLAFARRTAALKPSAVREILKVAEQPEVLSFAGGLPAPELFPGEAIAAAFARVLSDAPGQALQYSTTEGFAPLREWIAGRLEPRGVKTALEDLVVTNGSQQGIDLVAKVLLDPGDVVLVENPTYLAALQTFSAYEAKAVAVATDEEGMIPDALSAALAAAKPKLVYLIPDFQNPSGRTVSLPRRKEIVARCAAAGVPILEDDPYGELRFSGPALPSLAALAKDASAQVVYLGTFSKTLAPGLRLGFVTGPSSLIRRLVVAKQAADLQTGTLAQRATAALLRDFDFDGHLARLREVYGARCGVMTAALRRLLGDRITFSPPSGGLFIWARLPEGFDAEDLLSRAVAEKVAFVPGRPFFVDGLDRRHLRLNFSNQPDAAIEEGMRRLSLVFER